MPTDNELLRDYAFHRSESAFTELVRRHIDMVYSAALREAHGDAAQAEDITQAVFVEAARQASRLCRHPTFAGWLYTCVRRMAANARRADDRRQRRELEANAMKELLRPDSTAADWGQMQPVLDDAMHELSETDRAAVVLRFFEGQSHHEVGMTLGLSESAARKRVDRALEKLRDSLSRRGITSTAAGLTAALAVGSTISAPAHLAPTVASAALAAGTAAGAGTTLTFLKLMTMTKVQTAIIGAVVVAGIATPLAIQQHRAQATLRTENESLRQRVAQLESAPEAAATPADATQPLPNDPSNELLRLRSEVARLQSDSRELARLKASGTGGADQAASELLARINLLKQRFEQNPAEKIPELQYLSDDDWLRIGTSIRLNAPDEKVMEDQIAWGLSSLRTHAKQSIAGWIGRALRAYADANGGRLPTDPLELKPYFESPIDDATLQRYRMTKTGTVDGLQPKDTVLAEKAPVNNDRDTLFEIGLNGYQYHGIGKIARENGAGTWGTNVLYRIPLQQ